MHNDVSFMFGASAQEQLLAGLFFDQYGDLGGAELHAFLENVGKVELPFDLIAQMRRQDHPGFPGFECGLPPKYYYFIPGTCYGGHQCFPGDPLDPAFVSAVDGIGLNFGCPLRLKRALEVLLSLPVEFQKEPRQGLATATKHLPTVEELIVAGLWISPSVVTRLISGGRKSHDWTITFSDMTFNIECK